MGPYRMRDVERMLAVSRRTVLAFVQHGFVSPARQARGAYAFSFEDLVVLRLARDLTRAAVPASRIARSLRRLRGALREGATGEPLRIAAIGDRIVVRRGTEPWQADSGQYLLELWVARPDAPPRLAPRPTPGPSAQAAFERGAELEEHDAPRAIERYRAALSLDPGCAAAAANLGRLLHQQGRFDEAAEVYRDCLARAPDALVHFNFAVLLEDRGDPRGAVRQYEAALRLDPRFADGHYNLSLLHESLGERGRALRHLRTYRSLISRPG
jgi:tetratricopeptide (TPR) repeat protein